MEPKTRNILLAAVAGVALAYFFSKKDKKKKDEVIAAVDPNAKFLGVGGDVGGRSFSGPSKNYMPTENAAKIQKLLNFFNFNGFDKLGTDGKFGPLSYAYLQRARQQWAATAEKARLVQGVLFFSNPNIFYDPTDSDKISFDLMGGGTMTVRKSLYDKLSSLTVGDGSTRSLPDSEFTAADASVYEATPSTNRFA
jgi:hypothetical protein